MWTMGRAARWLSGFVVAAAACGSAFADENDPLEVLAAHFGLEKVLLADQVPVWTVDDDFLGVLSVWWAGDEGSLAGSLRRASGTFKDLDWWHDDGEKIAFSVGAAPPVTGFIYADDDIIVVELDGIRLRTGPDAIILGEYCRCQSGGQAGCSKDSCDKLDPCPQNSNKLCEWRNHPRPCGGGVADAGVLLTMAGGGMFSLRFVRRKQAVPVSEPNPERQ